MARLGDVGKIITGNTPKTSDEKNYESNDICFVKPSDISDSEITKLSSSEFYISEYARKKARILPPRSVLVTCIGIIGKVAINAIECAFNQQINAIIPDESKCTPEYLAYAIQYKQDDLRAIANAPVVPIINKTQFSEIEVKLPLIAEQRRVTNELKIVDMLLSLRKQQLAKLDELVKSRFVELFGDPSSNPMGWKETTVGEECHYIKDGPHKSLPDVGEGNGYPFISVRNIVNGYIDFSTAKYISKQDYLDSIKKCHPQKGDMLYSKGGTTGIAKLVDVDVEFANWVHVAVLKFDDSLNGIFFENMLNSDYCYDQSQKLTKGIANRDLVLSAMAQIKMYKPPLELQEQFAAFVEQTDKSKLVVQQSIDQLETLKKSLMQKYFG